MKSNKFYRLKFKIEKYFVYNKLNKKHETMLDIYLYKRYTTSPVYYIRGVFAEDVLIPRSVIAFNTSIIPSIKATFAYNVPMIDNISGQVFFKEKLYLNLLEIVFPTPKRYQSINKIPLINQGELLLRVNTIFRIIEKNGKFHGKKEKIYGPEGS